jgi:hypothetical protein
VAARRSHHGALRRANIEGGRRKAEGGRSKANEGDGPNLSHPSSSSLDGRRRASARDLCRNTDPEVSPVPPIVVIEDAAHQLAGGEESRMGAPVSCTSPLLVIHPPKLKVTPQVTP